MSAESADMSLFFKHSKSILEGLKATYVVDTLVTRNDEFEEVTPETGKRFATHLTTFDNIRFDGFRYKTC